MQQRKESRLRLLLQETHFRPLKPQVVQANIGCHVCFCPDYFGNRKRIHKFYSSFLFRFLWCGIYSTICRKILSGNCIQMVSVPGKHVTSAKHRKTCTVCQAWVNMQPVSNAFSVLSVGKHVTSAKHRKTYPVQNAGENATLVVPSAGNLASSAKSRKTCNRCELWQSAGKRT